jgi:hypothetical protein
MNMEGSSRTVSQGAPLPHLMAGLVCAGVMIVLSLVMQFTDLARNATAGFAVIGVFMVLIAFFVYNHARSTGGGLFGSLFSYGFKATAVATLVTIAFQVVFFLVFPEYRDQMFEIAREQMVKQGQLTGDQISQALDGMRRFFWPMVIGGSLFNTLVAGAIGSLIGAGISPKREARVFE